MRDLTLVYGPSPLDLTWTSDVTPHPRHPGSQGAHRSRNGAERRSRTSQEKQAKAAPRLGHYISTTRNTGHCHAAVASRGGLTPFASANAQRPLQRTLAFCAVRPRAFHARRSGACGCVSGREGPDIETETVRHAARFRGVPVPPPRTHIHRYGSPSTLLFLRLLRQCLTKEPSSSTTCLSASSAT